jgi:uncharacterized membrane protein YdbT with pleckstrin-like domain
MLEQHTIKSKSSRKLYFPYYILFAAIFSITLLMSIQGTLTLPAFTTGVILIFLGINATEIHRVWQSYEVNPHSVVHTKGYISKHSKRIDLFAINSITVTQTLYQRIFNIGDIHIHVANASHQTALKNIHSPKIFAQTIEQNMHKLRNAVEEDGTNTHSNTSNTQQSSKHPRENDFFDSSDEESLEEDSAETSDNLQEV